LVFERELMVEVPAMNKMTFVSTLMGALLVSGLSLAQSPAAQRMQALQSAFHAAHPSARLDHGLAVDPLAHASRLEVYVPGETPLERSRVFLKRWRGVFGLESLELVHAKTVTMKGRVVVRFDLHYEGLPIVGRQIVTTFDDVGALLRVTSDALPVTPLEARHLDAQQAVERAERHTGQVSRDGSLVREAVHLDRRGAVRVWLVALPGQVAVIDARDGSLRTTRTAVHR
jgi:hypothetical protein